MVLKYAANVPEAGKKNVTYSALTVMENVIIALMVYFGAINVLFAVVPENIKCARVQE